MLLKTMKNWMNRTGQISIDMIMMMFMLGLMFYIFLLLWEPLVIDLLFPYLDNFAYGSVMKVLFQLIPFILAFMILANPFTLGRQQTYQ